MAAQRLPGKPLADLAGRPLIEHVYRAALQATAQSVVIATDNEAIREAATAFGAQVVMTRGDHHSGSDRIAECTELLGWPDEAVIVNLQGDEPLMPAACLDQVADLLAADQSACMASLYWPLDTAGEIEDANIVKVVTDLTGTALLFSRSVVPYPREWGNLGLALQAGARWKRHIGLYACRAGALQSFSRTPPTPLETVEKLEQLRMLETGRRIVLAQACRWIPAGVDTPEDLERVRQLMK